MEIVVFGAGYVGLVTGAGLASSGNHITVIDPLKSKIDMLKKGEMPFYEPQLPGLVASSQKRGNLDFAVLDSKEYRDALERAEFFFIAVGTPPLADGTTDLRQIWSCVDQISALKGDLADRLVVVKSTVPVGTGDEIEDLFKKKKKFPAVVSNPEFLKQGNAVQDFLKPERVIIGTDEPNAREALSFLYKPFMLKRERIVCVSRRSSELIKYACNTFLATKISFINEVARLCEVVGADVREVREGMISDSRIGDQFLFPGIGYGGSCFPKDVQSWIAQGEVAGVKLPLASATQETNEVQKHWAFEKLKAHFGKNLAGKTVCLWGLSFKPNTDDLREAPSLVLIEDLISAKVKIRAYDPIALNVAEAALASKPSAKRPQLFKDAYDAAEDADALVIVTEWAEFRTPNLRKLKSLMRTPVIFDGRNVLDTAFLRSYGFDYISVGSKPVAPSKAKIRSV